MRTVEAFPAFFLPFQDISTHNHTPQWTQEVANMPVPDGGVCIPVSGGCQNDRGGVLRVLGLRRRWHVPERRSLAVVFLCDPCHRGRVTACTVPATFFFSAEPRRPAAMLACRPTSASSCSHCASPTEAEAGLLQPGRGARKPQTAIGSDVH
jgi:hypothetical protein